MPLIFSPQRFPLHYSLPSSSNPLRIMQYNTDSISSGILILITYTLLPGGEQYSLRGNPHPKLRNELW
jgi:hypothetical protein